MGLFGQSEMVAERNQLSLFAPKNDRDIAGTNRDNRDILTGGEGHEPGHYGTPPLKGGVQCPDGSGSEMSRSRPDPAEAFKNRNDRDRAFAAWDRDYVAWQAAGCPGGPDAWPRPPAGLTGAIASCLIPRRTMGGKKWR